MATAFQQKEGGKSAAPRVGEAPPHLLPLLETSEPSGDRVEKPKVLPHFLVPVLQVADDLWGPEPFLGSASPSLGEQTRSTDFQGGTTALSCVTASLAEQVTQRPWRGVRSARKVLPLSVYACDLLN